MKKKGVYTVIIVLLIILAYSFFSVDTYDNIQNETIDDFVDVGVKEFIMTVQDFSYNPSEINVDKGDVVKIKITSLDLRYGFSLLAFNIQEELKPNEEVIVEFVADKQGSFPYISHIFSGKGHYDLKGVIIVE